MSQRARIVASASRAASREGEPARGGRTGLVLCGGKSTRMGRDKALLEMEGRSLVARAADVLAAVAPDVWLACGAAPRYAELGRRLVLDAEPDAGPLAGLAAGLGAIADGWLCVLACDMPRVAPALYERLLAVAERDGLDACLAASERGVEPLCAVYHARCAGAVRAALARGERRVASFLGPDAGLRVGTVPVGAHGGGDPTVNLNTPEDYAREHAAGAARVRAACSEGERS